MENDQDGKYACMTLMHMETSESPTMTRTEMYSMSSELVGVTSPQARRIEAFMVGILES